MFLGVFALVNAGVRIDGVGSMTLLVSVSLIFGKFGGVVRPNPNLDPTRNLYSERNPSSCAFIARPSRTLTPSHRS